MQTTKVNQDRGNVVAAGITGAVIGAGVAVAATAAMSDKKTRTKVLNTLNSVKDEVKRKVSSEVDEVQAQKKKISAKKRN